MRHSGQAINEQPIDWSVVKKISPYLTEFKGRIIIALLFMILAKLSTIALPFALKLIVDSLNGKQVDSTFINENIPALLLTPIALVFAYGFFRLTNVLFAEIRDTLFSRVTERTIRRVSLVVFKHLHALDVNFHLERRTGGLARDIERGTHGISFILRFMVFNIVPTLIEISLVVGILLTNFGLSFGLVTGAAIAIYIIFSVITTNWRNQFVRETNQADSNSSTRAIDSLLNYETVKYFTNEAHEAKRYDEGLVIWEKAKTKNRLSLFALNSGQALIISVAITTLMYMAVTDVISQKISVGDFVMINAFMMQLFLPLNFLGFIYREVRVALVNIEKLFDLLATKPSVTEKSDAIPLKEFHDTIYFESVHFTYDHKRPILQGLSFQIEPKQTVAVVGSSGAGKSTIAKLLLRFFDTTQGRILFGKVPIENYTLTSLREHIGVVPQDTVLFNDTIFENIRYGRPNASDDDVQKAIELAHLNQFIEKLPEGKDTLVGERGLKLSGGEKQRVSIARALIKNPPILIFDEATSSLDSRSESSILAAIDEISTQYTSLIIAHRLSTIINADKIIVLEEGKIIEQGTHQELLKQKATYFDLWQSQLKKQADKQ